ncbi:DUF1707 domain-containing protein [Pseudonocardia aurantiaca]|uniref:DUF1707 domain-containing protein n=1 Tax=Pseudonocardia aurantiaca TaxID=75290 RepID=A0ABW4FMQ0_9PSEU
MPPAWQGKRARDLDRIRVRAALDSAYADGQLDGAEHRTRSAAATAAKTLTELQVLVRDLQVPKYLAEPPEPGTPAPTPEAPPSGPSVPTLTGPLPPRSRPFARFAAEIRTILILIGVLTIVLAISTRDWSDDPPPPPTPGISAGAAEAGPGVDPIVVSPVALHTPEGFRRFVEAVRTEFGSSEVVDAMVYADLAYVHVPVPGAPGRVRTYQYEGGFGEPLTADTREADDPLVDLAVYDVEAILGLVAGAGQSLNVENANHVNLTFRDIGDGPVVTVEALNEFGEYGRLEARADGTIIALRPFEPE